MVAKLLAMVDPSMMMVPSYVLATTMIKIPPPSGGHHAHTRVMQAEVDTGKPHALKATRAFWEMFPLLPTVTTSTVWLFSSAHCEGEGSDCDVRNTRRRESTRHAPPSALLSAM